MFSTCEAWASCAGLQRQADGGVSIGALTTLAAIEHSPLIRRDYPVLYEATKTVASPVLRNMGTLGGNICLDTRCLWYNQSLLWRKSCGFCLKKDGDLVPRRAEQQDLLGGVLGRHAAGAAVPGARRSRLLERAGTRRVPLSEFYVNDGIVRLRLAPGEIVDASRSCPHRRRAGAAAIRSCGCAAASTIRWRALRWR